jgi:hypothetical protein
MRRLVAGVIAVLTVAGFAPSGRSTPGAPVIASVGKFAYVNGVATNNVGTPGVFQLSDPGSTVTGYLYAFGTTPFISVAAGKDGSAKLDITPATPSLLDLEVSAVDGSSPPGPATTFAIEPIGPQEGIATLAWWKLNASRGSTATDATGYGKVARLSGDAAFGCPKRAAPDGYRCSMSVAGKGGQALTTQPEVSLSTSFSVSAWVNLTKCATSCVALSQDASHVFQFALRYQRVCRAGGKKGACWKFTESFDDQVGTSQGNAASAPGTAKLGAWTQLTGVFFAQHQQLLIYVNGVQGPEVGSGVAWGGGSDGPIRIGNQIPGGTSHDWNGRISDVCAFYGVLQPSDAVVADQGDKAHPHDGCAALFAKYP